MITCDGAGASHDLIKHLDKLAARPGHQLVYSVGWALGEREKTALRLVPEQAWQIAIDARGEVRERRADDACPDERLRAPGLLDRGSARHRADRAAARRTRPGISSRHGRRRCGSSPAASGRTPARS